MSLLSISIPVILNLRASSPTKFRKKKTLLRYVEEYITEVLWERYETKVVSNVANKEAFLYYFNEIRVFRAVFVICSWLFRDLFVICSWFFRNLFAICSQFVIYSRIVRNLFANCLQIICSPLFTNKANKTRISRSLFAFFKNHECLFVFYFGLFVDTLGPSPWDKELLNINLPTRTFRVIRKGHTIIELKWDELLRKE